MEKVIELLKVKRDGAMKRCESLSDDIENLAKEYGVYKDCYTTLFLISLLTEAEVPCPASEYYYNLGEFGAINDIIVELGIDE